MMVSEMVDGSVIDSVAEGMSDSKLEIPGTGFTTRGSVLIGMVIEGLISGPPGIEMNPGPPGC